MAATVDKAMEKDKYWFTIARSANWSGHYGNQCRNAPKCEEYNYFRYDLAIPLLDIYPKVSLYIPPQRHSFIHLHCWPFHSAESGISLDQKSAHAWIIKVWHTCTMEFYSAINNRDSQGNRWNQKKTIVSEVSQTQTDKRHMFSHADPCFDF